MAEGRAGPPRRGKYSTLLACFIAQNLAMGLGFGSFGPLMAINEAHFDVSRTFATLGMSMITVALSLFSPILGKLLQRSKVRPMMMGAALLSALSYAALGLLSSYYVALLCYVSIGAAIAILAVLGPLTLVNRWAETGRGKILALINLPLVLFVIPYAIARAEPIIGRLPTYLVMASLFLLLIPVLFLVGEGPKQRNSAAPFSSSETSDIVPSASPLRSLPFWAISLGVGLLAGSGIVFVVHIVPFGLEKGLSLEQAAMILSVYSGAGILGTLIFGWLADRLTPPRALMLATLLMAGLWSALISTESFSAYLLIAMLIGVCGVPLTTLHGAAISALFGPSGAAHAMGYSFAVKLPFLIGSAPLAALFFERSGNYQFAFQLIITALLLAALLFAFIALRRTPAMEERLATR